MINLYLTTRFDRDSAAATYGHDSLQFNFIIIIIIILLLLLLLSCIIKHDSLQFVLLFLSLLLLLLLISSSFIIILIYLTRAATAYGHDHPLRRNLGLRQVYPRQVDIS
jgi:uncharacterized Tic20 family protein